MKLGRETRNSFHPHETYQHCFQNLENYVKCPLRNSIRFIAVVAVTSAISAAVASLIRTPPLPKGKANSAASSASARRALPSADGRLAVAAMGSALPLRLADCEHLLGAWPLRLASRGSELSRCCQWGRRTSSCCPLRAPPGADASTTTAGVGSASPLRLVSHGRLLRMQPRKRAPPPRAGAPSGRPPGGLCWPQASADARGLCWAVSTSATATRVGSAGRERERRHVRAPPAMSSIGREDADRGSRG